MVGETLMVKVGREEALPVLDREDVTQALVVTQDDLLKLGVPEREEVTDCVVQVVGDMDPDGEGV